jgi:hypothetical protein
MALGMHVAGEIGSALAADVIATVPAARRIEPKSFMFLLSIRIELDLAKPALNAIETSVWILRLLWVPENQRGFAAQELGRGTDFAK